MDLSLDFSGIPMWIILFLLVVVLLYIYGTYPYYVWRELGYPDGPKPVPFVGSIVDMFDPKKGSIVCIREWVKQYGRVIPIYWFRDPILIVTDSDALREIFIKNFHNWTDRYMLERGNLQQDIVKKGIFLAEGPDWHRFRKIMSPTFSNTKLKLLTHHVNVSSRRLADRMRQHAEEGEPVMAKSVFAAFSLDTLCSTAFGLDTDFQNNPDQPFFKHTLSVLNLGRSAQFKLALACIFPFLGKVFRFFGMAIFKQNDVDFLQRTLTKLVQERRKGVRKSDHPDFLQLLVDAVADDDEDIKGSKKLTTYEITAQGITFIVAGFDTTSSLLQFIMYELSRNQNVQEKLVAEIETIIADNEPDFESCKQLNYMEAVINETLRIYPPSNMTSRVANDDTTINGRPVPAGTPALIPLANISRDPEFFPNPETFDPERFIGKNKDNIDPVTFIPFGLGPRQCIGLRQGVMQVKVALVHVLRQVRVVKATPSVLELNDSIGILSARVPIQLFLEKVGHNV